MVGMRNTVNQPSGGSFMPDEKLSVTLEAQQWDQILVLLSEVQAPLRITGPLVEGVRHQLMQTRAMAQAPFPRVVPEDG
jgi:hypothetical protein